MATTLDLLTAADAKPGSIARMFVQEPDYTAPDSKPIELYLLNERLRDMGSVKSMALSDPTALSPTKSDAYVVNPTGTGAWAGEDNSIATYNGSAWVFSPPSEGWVVYDQNLNKHQIYNGSAWADMQASSIGYDNGTSGLTADDVQAAIDELENEIDTRAPTASPAFTGVPLVPTYTVGTLPTATASGVIYVSDETGGAVLAFADGTNWRRVTDRAIVS